MLAIVMNRFTRQRPMATRRNQPSPVLVFLARVIDTAVVGILLAVCWSAMIALSI